MPDKTYSLEIHAKPTPGHTRCQSSGLAISGSRPVQAFRAGPAEPAKSSTPSPSFTLPYRQNTNRTSGSRTIRLHSAVQLTQLSYVHSHEGFKPRRPKHGYPPPRSGEDGVHQGFEIHLTSRPLAISLQDPDMGANDILGLYIHGIPHFPTPPQHQREQHTHPHDLKSLTRCSETQRVSPDHLKPSCDTQVIYPRRRTRHRPYSQASITTICKGACRASGRV